MARPFKCICDRNPSYFQFVKIMQLEGLRLAHSVTVIIINSFTSNILEYKVMYMCYCCVFPREPYSSLVVSSDTFCY